MPETTFDHGDYTTISYTPASGNVAAGQVVLLGNTTGMTCGIAHHDIVNATLGSLDVGGGHHDVVNLNNAANYAKVWWDDSVAKVTTVSTNNALFGYISEGGGAGANTSCRAFHWPYV